MCSEYLGLPRLPNWIVPSDTADLHNLVVSFTASHGRGDEWHPQKIIFLLGGNKSYVKCSTAYISMANVLKKENTSSFFTLPISLFLFSIRTSFPWKRGLFQQEVRAALNHRASSATRVHDLYLCIRISRPTEVVVRFFVYSKCTCFQRSVDSDDPPGDIISLPPSLPLLYLLYWSQPQPSPHSACSILLLLNPPLGREPVTSCCSAPLSEGAWPWTGRPGTLWIDVRVIHSSPRSRCVCMCLSCINTH